MTNYITLFIYFAVSVFLTGFTELVSFKGKLIFYVTLYTKISSLFKSVLIQAAMKKQVKGIYVKCQE